jgi:hypothetical protein
VYNPSLLSFYRWYSKTLYLALNFNTKSIVTYKRLEYFINGRLSYNISGIIITSNPTNLKEFSTFVRLPYNYNIDYKTLLPCSTKLNHTLVQGEGVSIYNR